MTVVNQGPPALRLPGREKLLIGALLCLQIPATVVFLPMAAVFVLTGILAPLGMMAFAVGTMPFSLAMRRKSAWQSDHHRQEDRDAPLADGARD
jgi:hypothetical protein